MSPLRLEIDLGLLHHNASTLVDRLGRRGIAITGVSKATLGLPEIVQTWVAAGVGSIGESRIESIEALARLGLAVPLLLIRSPLLSQVDRVVAHAAISCNSEVKVLKALAAAAMRQGLRHGVLLMVELGDLREGLLVEELEEVVQLVLGLPSLELKGIGTNLGCQHGVAPDQANMAVLTGLANTLERRFQVQLPWCSGGNSANLPWLASGADLGRINHLRLGEALLLGREPLGRTPIPGMHTDAITLVAEVIEAKFKPVEPWGHRQHTSFSKQLSDPELGQLPCAELPLAHSPPAHRALLALGEQDVDPAGLTPAAGISILGASSDHLLVGCEGAPLQVGDEQRFQLSYSALLRAMTSPFVDRSFVGGPDPDGPAEW
ncbi:alanine/ornithine racemase family PLP-dependent enzyme [Cyanobium sp. WAJ14-Wanaka]|uniref:alanine/ornithine racemase family PLP-dependent enzyme n=1 Tax=Cyanobium sp. WAJ14-Wanaka TaxID=2823725 RepID=UPI0020CDB252|nr:alanine/ornithine racemase family PLP-dependent enzyme [Cyanobium sp. WAJ14-Wanaka]MCP9774461.1 alanine/ornithine racemase family PLP-dependent enzyme [Cyanobium sp. WAJ14-Wanaka]